MKNAMLSLFKGYSDTCPTETTLQEIVNLIKNDASVQDHTEKHRYYMMHGQTAAADREKAACPCFAVAVRFAGGKKREHICGWTKLCLVDIDDIPSEQLLELLECIRKDEHTLIAYITISGAGIRIICRIDSLEEGEDRCLRLYAKFFNRVNQYYARLLNRECDLKCKNATRLSGLAYDPDVYFSPKAKAFCLNDTVISGKEDGASGEVEPAASAKRNKRLERAVKVAERQMEEEGIAYVEHHHNEYIMRVGYLLNAYGVAQKSATEWARQRFSDYDGDVDSIFSSCYQNTEEHGALPLTRKAKHNDEGDNYFAPVADIENFLSTQARFRKNVITGKCEVLLPEGNGQYTEITDRYVNTLWCRICKEQAPVRINDMRCVLDSEYTELFNPFADYFQEQGAWDGITDYIGRLAATVHVKSDQAAFETYFKKWFVAMIASLLDPEVVNHEILVLIGRQGIYKTTWLNNLLPPALQRYFYIKSNNHHIVKDDLFTLTEFALLCLEELEEMTTAEVNQIKALTSMRNVNERMAYGHYKEHRAHVASFCGTGNNVNFLTDLSGNRRWLPFEVESIDNPYTHPVDYAGVYAQGYALWKSGFHYWFDDDEIEAVNLHNKDFEVPCLERELVLTHYRRPMPGEDCIFVTNAQILNRINGGIRQNLSPTKVGLVMKQAGFEAVRSATQRGYRVIELKSDEIYRNQCAIARYTTQP